MLLKSAVIIGFLHATGWYKFRSRCVLEIIEVRYRLFFHSCPACCGGGPLTQSGVMGSSLFPNSFPGSLAPGGGKMRDPGNEVEFIP